jgi:hypothetical protein
MRSLPALVLVASVLALSGSSAVVSQVQQPSTPSLALRGGGEMVAEVVAKRFLACGGSVSDGVGMYVAYMRA